MLVFQICDDCSGITLTHTIIFLENIITNEMIISQHVDRDTEIFLPNQQRTCRCNVRPILAMLLVMLAQTPPFIDQTSDFFLLAHRLFRISGMRRKQIEFFIQNINITIKHERF